LVEFLKSNGNATRGEVFRWDDPVPGIAELSQYTDHIVRGLARRVAGLRHQE